VHKSSFQTFLWYVLNYVYGCIYEFVLEQPVELIVCSPSLQDVLGTILSKLPPKEMVRTSVLSNEWKHIWTVCPKLRFDGAAMCGQDVPGTQHYTRKFIDNVNGVLKQYHGKVVEEFGVKF